MASKKSTVVSDIIQYNIEYFVKHNIMSAKLEVELILLETKRIVRMKNGIIIVETNNGTICANAGVDESNVKEGYATLLPINSDTSAQTIRNKIREQTNKNVAVIISDTFGRPFRMGQTNCAIGISGLNPILNYLIL